jgi:hypothetical protein
VQAVRRDKRKSRSVFRNKVDEKILVNRDFFRFGLDRMVGN